MGAHRVGPCFIFVPAGDNVAAARPAILGHGSVAHGLECERGGNE